MGLDEVSVIGISGGVVAMHGDGGDGARRGTVFLAHRSWLLYKAD